MPIRFAPLDCAQTVTKGGARRQAASPFNAQVGNFALLPLAKAEKRRDDQTLKSNKVVPANGFARWKRCRTRGE
jgi:hypothetical protein